MKTYIYSHRFIVVFSFLYLASATTKLAAQVNNDRKQFKEYLSSFRKNPNDNALQEKIILLSLKISPAIPTPKDYGMYLQAAKEKANASTTISERDAAITELNRAISIAPWKPEAYYNIALLYGEYENYGGNHADALKAISNYQYFLLTNPSAAKTKEVQDKIKKLQEAYDNVNRKQEKKASVRKGWRDEFDAALLDGSGLGSIFKGASCHASFRLGANFPSTPLILNNSSGNYSTSEEFYGTGIYAGLEFWPLCGQYFGLGGFADASYGISGNLAVTGNFIYAKKLNYNYGGNVYLGSRNVKLIFNYTKATTNFSDATVAGLAWDKSSTKIDFGSTKYGGGFRFYIKKKRKDLDLMILFEKVDFLPHNSQKSIQVYHIGYTKSGKGFLQLEFAPNYPVAGNMTHPANAKYKATSIYLSLTLAHSFDFYGRRFRNQNW